MLDIRFLGKVTIKYNGQNIEEQLGSKAIALICLLALNHRKYMSREKLEGYLWPDSDTEAAKYNLRYNLWLVKKNIGKDKDGGAFLYIDNECCGINSKYKFKCDIIDIIEFIPSQKDSIENIIKLKQLFRGDLLEGYYFKNCDELNELIIFERMKFEQQKIKVLKCLVKLYENKGEYTSCLKIIDKILEIEPYDEDMVLKALNIFVECGKPVSAVSYYNDFSKVLANNLGVFPSEKLRKKYNHIKESLSTKEYDKQSLDKTRDYHHLEINSFCIKDIEFFWISDVIKNIVDITDCNCINQLNERELFDLGYIQPDILNCPKEKVDLTYDGYKVMSVGIVNSFIKLLTCLCKSYKLTIIISNSTEIDNISKNVLDYLKEVKLKNLNFIEK